MNGLRKFQKINGEHINDFVAYVLFDFTGETVKTFSISKKGEKRSGANWTFKDALSLVESGHWMEIPAEDKPTTVAEIDGGAW